MTALDQFLGTHKLDEAQAMNQLQQNGIVSDECVTAKDVSEADQMDAVSFLFSHNGTQRDIA